jgi:thiamine-monophosphate kinase
VADLEELYRGMADLAAGFRVSITGGDTVSSPVTMLSITVLGELQGEALRRAAGRPGDLLAVTGTLGGSAGGLTLLEAGKAALDNPDAATLVRLHRNPQPRVVEGLTLAEAGVRCGMDLSDGLLGDAGKLAYASGLSAVLELSRLPMHPALWRRFGDAEARLMALAGGEDFELLIAAPPNVIDRAVALFGARNQEPPTDGQLLPLTVVGRLKEGEPGTVTVLDQHGQPVAPPRSSWDHFQQTETRL